MTPREQIEKFGGRAKETHRGPLIDIPARKSSAVNAQ
jgi:hypothetical protein